VFFHDRLPTDGFWVEGRGRSLCHANAEFNAKLSELAYTIAMQGFGVMEIVNPDPTRNIEIGPGRAIAFNVSGNTPLRRGLQIAERAHCRADHRPRILFAHAI
jgi:hypothetical protein